MLVFASDASTRHAPPRVPHASERTASVAADRTPSNAAVRAAVRPRVAVQVRIESDLYRKKLDGNATSCGPNCATLERTLSDTLRAMFAARFRFADWSSSGQTADTVSLRLLQRNSGGGVKLVVSLQGRARQFGGAPEEVEFERWIFAVSRPLGDWTPTRLRLMWADSIGRRLDANASRLIGNVIGRLPLVGDVTIDSTRPTADVRVPADSLRAADSPAPKFMIRLAMPTPTTSGDIVSDTGELVLETCKRTIRGFYTCDMGVFRWRDRSGSDTLYRQKSRNVRVRTASVHLQEYTPAPASLGAGGLAAPRNP